MTKPFHLLMTFLIFLLPLLAAFTPTPAESGQWDGRYFPAATYKDWPNPSGYIMLDGSMQAPYGDFQDIAGLRRVTTDYFTYLARAGNIVVTATFAPHSWWRKDWAMGTFMRINPNTIYITNLYGQPSIRVWPFEPPSTLDGCRAPQKNAPMNADGTIPENDRCYASRYPIWVERPVLELNNTLEQPAHLALWLYALNANGGVAKYARELEAIGLNPATGRPFGYSGDEANMSTDLNQLILAAGQDARDFGRQYNGLPDQERLTVPAGATPVRVYYPDDSERWELPDDLSIPWYIYALVAILLGAGVFLLHRRSQRMLVGTIVQVRR